MELNVSQATISAYETGERTPDIETLLHISSFFNVSVDYLLGNSDFVRTLSTDLTSDETNFLRLYQKLSTLQREKTFAYMNGLLD